MAATNIVSTLNGNYKRIYGKIVNAVPSVGYLLKNVRWDKGNMVGASYEELVIVRSENGYTYGGSAGTNYTLNASVAMGTEPARVTPFEYTMRSAVSYGAASRAAKAGPRAFAKWSALILKNMTQSVTRRLEISLIHGQHAEGIGSAAIDAFTDLGGAGLTATILFAEDQWAPGIWRGAEGALLNAYDGSDVIIADSANIDLTVTKVNFRTRTVTVTGTAALIDAIETANDSAATAFFFKGSRTSDMVGMKQIFSNLTGTIHEISADTNGAWAGNLFDCGSESLSHAKIMGYAAELYGRGHDEEENDEDMIVLVSVFTWVDLHQEQAAARVYDASYEEKMAKQGFKAIRYFSPSGQWLSIVAHPCVKGGEALMFPMSRLKRIGSAEKEWEIPGADSDPWYPQADANGAEIRNYSDMTVFCSLPAECAYIDNIVNDFGTTG